jgi:hypothetical protein
LTNIGRPTIDDSPRVIESQFRNATLRMPRTMKVAMLDGMPERPMIGRPIIKAAEAARTPETTMEEGTG